MSNTQTQSQALPALVNAFCFPGLGQLIQGRFLAAVASWFLHVMAAFSILVTLAVGVFFAGCDATREASELADRGPDQTRQAVTSGESNRGSAKEHLPNLKIGDVRTALEAAGFEVGARNGKIFQLLQAADGCGFEVNGETVEIYEFDLSIKSGREAFQRLKDEGFMGQACSFHENLAYLMHRHSEGTAIREVIEGLPALGKSAAPGDSSVVHHSPGQSDLSKSSASPEVGDEKESDEDILPQAHLGKTLRLGNVEVTPVKLARGPVKLWSIFRDSPHESESSALSIYLKTRNISEAKVFHVRATARVIDEFGNEAEAIGDTSVPLAFERIVDNDQGKELQPGDEATINLAVRRRLDRARHYTWTITIEMDQGEERFQILTPLSTGKGDEFGNDPAEDIFASEPSFPPPESQRAPATEAAKWRTWTTANGKHKVEAKFVRFDGGIVTLQKRDGATVDVKLDILCSEDQEFVKQRNRAMAREFKPASPKNTTDLPSRAEMIARILADRSDRTDAGDDGLGNLSIDLDTSVDLNPAMLDPIPEAKPKTEEPQPTDPPEMEESPVTRLPNAAKVTAEDLDRALLATEPAIQAWTESPDLPSYRAFAKLGEAVALVEEARPKSEEAVHSLLELLGSESAKMEILAKAGTRLLEDPDQREGSGVLLVGVVKGVERKGDLYETQLEVTSGEDPVLLYDDADPGEVYKAGSKTLILGAIIEDPAANLKGYDGSAKSVVWSGAAQAVADEGDDILGDIFGHR